MLIYIYSEISFVVFTHAICNKKMRITYINMLSKLKIMFKLGKNLVALYITLDKFFDILKTCIWTIGCFEW